MKSVLFFSAIAGASAFAPVSQSTRAVSELVAAASLEGLRGVGPETGNKIVSREWAKCRHTYLDGMTLAKNYHFFCFVVGSS